MAARKTTTRAKAKVVEEPVVTTTTTKKVDPAPKKREYRDDDQIPCFSITPGEYLFEGDKSKTVYSWVDAGITEGMRYDDLTSAVRTRKPCIFKPRIVIQDDEFLRDYPELQRLYDSLHSKDDLTQIFNLEASQMAQVIEQLPDGAKDAIRSMAVKAIEDGTLDSVARVRALDRIFGTDMLLKLAN
jgi:hypothetical protein